MIEDTGDCLELVDEEDARLQLLIGHLVLSMHSIVKDGINPMSTILIGIQMSYALGRERGRKENVTEEMLRKMDTVSEATEPE